MRFTITFICIILFTSCITKGVIPTAISKGEKINIRVENRGGAFTPFYDVLIQKNENEYELIHIDNSITNIYKLPINKLNLLLQMEVSFLDLNKLGGKYCHVTISSSTSKRSYKINTDLVANFIKGLKKK